MWNSFLLISFNLFWSLNQLTWAFFSMKMRSKVVSRWNCKNVKKSAHDLFLHTHTAISSKLCYVFTHELWSSARNQPWKNVKTSSYSASSLNTAASELNGIFSWYLFWRWKRKLNLWRIFNELVRIDYSREILNYRGLWGVCGMREIDWRRNRKKVMFRTLIGKRSKFLPLWKQLWFFTELRQLIKIIFK